MTARRLKKEENKPGRDSIKIIVKCHMCVVHIQGHGLNALPMI